MTNTEDTGTYWTRHNERIAHTHKITLFRWGQRRLVLTYVPKRYRITEADAAYRDALMARAEQVGGLRAWQESQNSR